MTQAAALRALGGLVSRGENQPTDLLRSLDWEDLAEEIEGLARKYSLPLLAVVIACLFTAPFIKEYKSAIYSAALDYPPDVLRQKARDMTAALWAHSVAVAVVRPIRALSS